MTDVENEKLRRAQRRAVHTGIRVEELFPEIERIIINYTNEHRSAFGVIINEDSRVITPQHEAVFVIECLNRECSSIGFDLKDEIYSMRRSKQTELTGEKECEGQEAPDHPEQSCGSTLKFTIKVQYK